MARVTIQVAKTNLQKAINDAEKNGPLSNLSSLNEAVSKLYNLSPRDPSFPEISPSVVGLRIKEFNLTHITTAGKRGRGAMSEEQKAAMAAGRAGGRKSRADKFADNPKISFALTQLKDRVPERFQPKVDKVVEGGSMRAAVTLKCLDCTCYQTSEIRNCGVLGCALWAFRPYQGAATEDDPETETEEVEELEDVEVAA